MDMKNVASKAIRIYTGIGSIVVGLIFLVVGILILTAPKDQHIPVEATIVAVEEVEVPGADFDDPPGYHLYLNYTVNGKEYKNILYEAGSSSDKVGDTITVEYDKDDPASVQSTGGDLFSVIAIVIGVAAIGFGVFRLISKK